MYFSESIIDIPRKTYAKGVFDNADTENPKLKAGVIAMIKKQIAQFEKYAPVEKFSLIGSILTKRYREDADLDINVLFDVSPSEREPMRKAIAKNLKDINGKLIPGTKHPINYYVITDPELKKKNDAMADGVFDVEENKFIRKPEGDTFEPEKYEAEFQKRVRELDIVQGELKRDLVDYKELTELSDDDILNLQELIGKKLYEIEDSIKTLVDIGDEVFKQRQDAFANDMSPEEIKTFGKKHKLPKNVIYKYLEKYHYMKMYKKLKDILEDGEITDDEIDSIDEAPRKTIAFTFGRFNPPTIGHEKLIKKVKSISANDYRIYLSRSEDPKKNPLSPRQKLDVMKKMFPQYASKIMINPTNMILDIATDLYKKGFTEIFMVVGSDRVREFETILNKYNDVRSRHGYYNFDNINVVSAGERDPDAEGAMGMSASKMRAAASKNDLVSFKKGLPSSFRNADALMKQVRQGMKLAASYGSIGHHQGYAYKPIASLEQFEQQQIRDMYIREMVFNVGDKINNIKLNIEGKVVRRGTNYVLIEDENNNLHKSWIWDCLPLSSDKEAIVREYNTNVDYGFEAVSNIDEDKKDGHTRRLPQDKSIGSKKGSQPKKYYKGLKKDVKGKRDAFFKRQDTTDTTPSSYKAAPGDKDAKTKPSKHTKKFKQMYGEYTMSEACWKGFKQVGMKKKNGKTVPNCVPESMSIEDAKRVEGYMPESYEIGHDYASYTSKITPGEPGYDPKFEGGSYEPSKPENNLKQVVKTTSSTSIQKKDIEEWSISNAVIHKYKERYKEQWRMKLDEVVEKMKHKLDTDNNA